MHALQHGIQNKRHIVNTKGTISPLLLIHTVLHHCCSTVVSVHLRGNALWWCKKRSQMRLQPKTRRHCAIPNSENSSDIPRQWQPVRPRTVSKPTPSSRSEPFILCMFQNHKDATFSLFDIIITLEFLKSGSITKQ